MYFRHIFRSKVFGVLEQNRFENQNFHLFNSAQFNEIISDDAKSNEVCVHVKISKLDIVKQSCKKCTCKYAFNVTLGLIENTFF